MATMKDVADLAGVSTATVSRVINRTSYVEPVTQERVERAIKALNYRRDARATALANRSNNTLGLLTGNLADPFFALIAKSVEEVARANGCQLVVVSGGHNAQREKEGIDFLISQGCEAMVVHSKMLDDTTLMQYAAQLPAMVLLNRTIAQISNRSVWIDNRAGARKSVEYLIEQGHRKIACITSDLPIEDRTDRLAGYRDAMNAANLAIPTGWVINQNFSESGGEEAGRQLIQACPGVTAVVTFNDVMAAGLMASLHEQGLSVPEDISVVGFDDVLLARYLYPRLTTMHNPIDEMSTYAAKLALNLRKDGYSPPSSHQFEASLVCRQTVKAIQKNG
ncbi:LacI family DNA-binding transcriptional regulator [Vibrio vulnificus]|uniref:LacI family DNA-binding transcriptional regulator n=1 Tax=Vibrio vulnificus TaxID=672 RepID=UPI00102A7175|nr:LacI family DNA-binding transcriptional regulator [Vibrio vulnificus]EGR0206989.1 LacI family DNA-binding transcriptional regulator [Vibrio vulnificus]EHU9443463.1 LacI family DNA-binding transcriptional regulator [Vibrio vulnificus]MCU8498845.1 LacI family DNA-binding transcriptional regulator [Vibrio vulnificus]RZQ00994.1 LacI family DNA-binding transcriptional regulator [Vibrio vulnificus]